LAKDLMRKALLAVTLLALLSTSIIPAISVQQLPKRIIEISQYGLVYVYDEVPSVGEETVLKFPRALVKNLVNYISPNDPNPRLEVENDAFSIIVKSKPGEIVHLTTIFRGQLFWNARDQSFQLLMPLYPLIPKAGKKPFYIEVRLPVDAQISEVSPDYLNQTGRGLLSATLSEVNLSSREFENLIVTFSSTSQKIIDVTSAKIIVEPFGGKIELALKLRNLGGGAGSRIYLKLPAGSKILETRDSVGAISNKYDEESGELTLNLRQPLGAGQSTYVEIEFRLPEENSVISITDGKLEVKPILPMNATAWVYEIEVILRGASLKSWSPEPYQLRRKYPETEIISYRFSHIDPINIDEDVISIEFERSFSLFSVLPYLTGAAILIFLIGAVTAIYVRKPLEKLEEEKPLKHLLDESQALISAYQAVADLITSGRIYEKGVARKIILEARAATRKGVEKLRKLGKEVEKAEPEASEEVQSLEKAIREFEKAIERAWDLAYPYFSGGLSRKRLSERLDGYRKELKRAYDQLINSLEALRRKTK